MIVRTVADRQVILAISPEAAPFGIQPGMTLTQARALCARVQHAEHEPLRDRRALEAMARWLMRFSPVVAFSSGAGTLPPPRRTGKARGASEDASPSGHDTRAAIFLDLTGCDRLFGGLPNLVGQIQSALVRLRVMARLAVAPTPGAAWALAESGKNVAIVAQEELKAALAPLPPAALRLSGDLVAALHHLGLCTIAQVAELPRDVLPARFGGELLWRLDQAMGDIAEPLVPLEHHAPVEAKMEFDGPVSSLEAIHAVIRHLLQSVVNQLTRRGSGARRVDLELSRAYAPPVKKTISLSHPSRDMKSLFNLTRCALEEEFDVRGGNRKRQQGEGEMRRPDRFVSPRRLLPSSPRSLPEPQTLNPTHNVYGDGYTAVHLRVPLLQRVTEEQISLIEQEQHASRLEMDRLVDRLRLRLGESGVAGVQLVESHLPEKAWKPRVETAEEADGQAFERPVVGREKRMLTRGGEAGKQPGFFPSNQQAVATASSPAPFFRPLHLRAHPEEIRVMVTPSDAIEGRPAAFAYQRQVHPVASWAGPERIAGQWWEGHHKTRDYFEIENPAGRRFWIFRVCETGKWYLHGMHE